MLIHEHSCLNKKKKKAMKKIYMAPQTEQVTIKSGQHLLDASMPITNEEAKKDGGYYNSDARGGSWFDDEDY